MGRRIAQLLPHSELVLVDGGHHADLFDVDPRLFTKIAAFAQGSGVDPR